MGSNATPSVSTESGNVYLDLQAALGITKHMGGLPATEELVELCQIGRGQKILDVGCGTGKTACYLARAYDCTVVGVDIEKTMVENSRERAKRGNVESKVQFRLADAQDLPFEDDSFDVVVGESVTAFVEDKVRAVREYRRTAKPAGFVGLNETTWVKAPPPANLAEYVSRTTGAKPETPETWQKLLGHAGLGDLKARIHRVAMLSEWVNEMRWLDLRDLLGPWFRLLPRYLRDPGTRRFVRMVLPVPKDYFEYFGFGIYVGTK